MAEVNFTNSGIGRPGEVKCLNLKKMFWSQEFNALCAQWFQRKTLKSNPTAFVADYDCPALCPLFSLGCYWACEDGLARTEIGEPKSPQRRKAMFVLGRRVLRDGLDIGIGVDFLKEKRGFQPRIDF